MNKQEILDELDKLRKIYEDNWVDNAWWFVRKLDGVIEKIDITWDE